ncbi:uncharacterized protein LOC108092968 [Drosophila ficusphila]|uniref:uncharacterized protein LOC108092968 n=1 Tax=Drosophila ficusphila TaxID=30025 RepID=UPI0007E8021A|nr:uncharacterized protein LOC108092968 [Drosophila ficusphila]
MTTPNSRRRTVSRRAFHSIIHITKTKNQKRTMGCCASSLKLKELSLNSSIYVAAGGSSSDRRSLKRLYSSRNSSGVGSSSSSSSACNSSKNSSRSIWSRSSQPICDDFAEQPQLERSCGYYTCSSADSSPRKSRQEFDEEMEMQKEQEQEVLMRTQDMSRSEQSRHSVQSDQTAGNLQWEMYMMQRTQCIMPKTSSPISQRRAGGQMPASSYQKWRNYLQSTPAHMLHNVTHIPEAIAGHFCPTTGFPGFSDLEEMESAAKRFKVDCAEEEEEQPLEEPLYTTYQLLAGHTHTISTDL